MELTTLDIALNNNINKLELINSIKDNYTKQIKKFNDYILSTGKTDFDYNDLQLYYEYLTGSRLSYSYINNLIFALKKRIKDLFQYETDITKKYFLNEKLKEIKTLKVNSKAIDKDRLIKKNEIILLLSKATDKLKVIIKTLIVTGCRINELTSIKLSDCKELNNYFEISILGKGDKIRTIKLSKDLFNKIKNTFNGQYWLFETINHKKIYNNYISNQIEKLSKRVLKKTFSAHSFRHYFATDRIKETKNIKGVSKYLGHSTTAITLDMYTHSELSFNDLFDLENDFNDFYLLIDKKQNELF